VEKCIFFVQKCIFWTQRFIVLQKWIYSAKQILFKKDQNVEMSKLIRF
jgi:hypothetical protein